MKRKIGFLLPMLGVILLVSASCAQPEPTESAPPLEKATFRVEVSRHGFNGVPGEHPLTVKEGQEVEITFVYGDTDLPENNPHTVTIPALAISTGILDKNNREETLRFRAPKPGELSFICGEPACTGHSNLLLGKITVQPR